VRSLVGRDGRTRVDVNYIRRGRPPVLAGEGDLVFVAPIVGSLKIEGELRVKEKAVRRRLRVKEGRPRNRAAVNDGIDRVLKFYHDRGYLMADVDSRGTRAPDGKVNLMLRVRAGPRVRIDIDGTRGQAALRQEIRPFWEKGLFLEDIVDQARERIETIYKDRGYLQVETHPEVLRDDSEQFRVRFSVRRGPRAKAGEVRLQGVRHLPEKGVRKVLRTSPDGPFTRGLVRQATLQADAAAIRALYRSRGFPGVSVEDPEVRLDSNGRRAVVAFVVQEGPLVKFGSPRFEGNHSFSSADLAKTA